MIKNQLISTDQVIKQKEGNIASNMGGEKVMLSVHNGKYYNLGETGGEIWEYIEEFISIKELIELLVAKYEVKESECREQVINFINLLMKEELIEIKS